jgi:hypothetical protein
MVKMKIVYEEPVEIVFDAPDVENRCMMCGKKEDENMLNMYAGNCLDCFRGCS